MSEDDTFAEFIRRVRAGDAAAAEELVRRYETNIRVAVRACLTDASLRRYFDSMDVCQSVLKSFFVRAAAGQYDLGRREDLLKLLVAMTRNKVAHRARYEYQDRRDPRRLADPAALAGVAAGDPSPSRVAEALDLLEQVRRRLGDEERRLADLRAAGRTWEEIAAELGGTPQGHRMRLTRAVERVARELGIDEVDDE
jgi:RNA polymerase sigma-70 factor (ECF subfamily)